jgi:hypothetical protein
MNQGGVLNASWANFWANMPHGFAAEFVPGQTAVSTECNGGAPKGANSHGDPSIH